MIVRMAEPENLEFPYSSLSDFITPNEQFYVRSHFAVPKIDVRSWKLSIEGAVKQKLEFTLNDLLKLPSRKLAIPGNGVLASRSHLVVKTRALSPIAFAQRNISGTPIGIAAN